MSTSIEKAGLQWKGRSYLFRHKVEKSFESFTFEGFNGDMIDQMSEDHPMWKKVNFQVWVKQKIKIVMENT